MPPNHYLDGATYNALGQAYRGRPGRVASGATRSRQGNALNAGSRGCAGTPIIGLYEPTTGTPYALNDYAIIPVGTAYRDGTWRELARDLSADLQSVFGVGVETVQWFTVRGSYDLDDLVLLDSARTTKYYMFNGQRVAMNRAGVVYYMLGDHLGSTAITVDNSGAKVSELRYKPYGEVRYSGLPNGTGTDFRFTGQRQLAGLELYHMGARWVDPSLGRWLSADTLVPEPANPQGLNRYSYTLGNPLKYVDPSGHEACAADDEWCWKNRWYCGDPIELDTFGAVLSTRFR